MRLRKGNYVKLIEAFHPNCGLDIVGSIGVIRVEGENRDWYCYCIKWLKYNGEKGYEKIDCVYPRRCLEKISKDNAMVEML